MKSIKNCRKCQQTSEASVKYFKEIQLNDDPRFIPCWSYSGMSSNKIQKIYNGNRRNVGYKFAVWNCGRGLLQEGFSIKLSEIKQLISKYKPHSFGIIESDLYSTNSSKSHKTFTKTELLHFSKPVKKNSTLSFY